MLRTAIKFGVFVLVCLSFTAWLGFLIGNRSFSDPLGRDNFQLTASFDDVTGLLVNDNVKVAGVVVGKVTGISVEQGRAEVTFQVSNDYQDALPTDTSAAIRWRNLIGQRYVYLYPGSASTTLEDGDEVTDTTSVIDLGELFNNLGPIVAAVDEGQVNDFLETVTQALDGNTDRVGQALDDLAVLATGLADRDQSLSRLVENLNIVAGTIATRDAQIRTMLDNLVLLAGTFSDNTAIVDQALVEFGNFSADLSTLLEGNRAEIDRIIAGLDVVVAEEVRPRLAQLDETVGLLDDMSRAIFNAGRFGEFMNQTILCAATAPPAGPGEGCATPIIDGASADAMASATAGQGAVSSDRGADVLYGLLGRELSASIDEAGS